MKALLLILTFLLSLASSVAQAQNWLLYKSGQRNILERRRSYDSLDNLSPDGIIRFNRQRLINNGAETEYYADSLLGIIDVNSRYVYESQYTYKLHSTFIGPRIILHHMDSSWSLTSYNDTTYRIAVKATPGQIIAGQTTPISLDQWTLLNGAQDSVKAFKLGSDTLYLGKNNGIVGFRGYRYSEFQYVPTIAQLFDKGYVQSYWSWSRSFLPAYSIDTLLSRYVFHSKRQTPTHTVFTFKIDTVESRTQRFYMNPRALHFDSIVYYYQFRLAINPFQSDSVPNVILANSYSPDSLISGVMSYNTLTRKLSGIERGIRRTELDRLPTDTTLFGRGPIRHGNTVEDYFPFTGLRMRLYSGWASGFKQEVVQYTDTAGRTFGTKPLFSRTRIVLNESNPSQDQNIHLYPNPTTGQVTVKGLQEPQTMTMINAMGQVVVSKLIEPSETLDLRLAAGIYHYQIGKHKHKLVIR